MFSKELDYWLRIEPGPARLHTHRDPSAHSASSIHPADQFDGRLPAGSLVHHIFIAVLDQHRPGRQRCRTGGVIEIGL